MPRRAVLVLSAIGVGGCILVLVAPPLIREVGETTSEGRTGVVAGETGGDCMPPPTFQEEDLLGTWSAGNDQRNDTLVLSEGGRYRQTIETESPPFSYESETLAWWVESREGGLPLLHLEGMRLCVYSLSPDCERAPAEVDRWYDFCSNSIVESRGEGLLIIAGVRPEFDQPLRGIELLPLTKDPDTAGWPYHLEE